MRLLLIVALLALLPAGSLRSEEAPLERTLNAARDALHESNYEAAIRLLENFESDQAEWGVQFWLGTAYLLDGQLDNAAVVLDEALALEAERAEIWVQRAIVEQERSQPEIALQILEVAAQVDNSYPMTFLNAGIAYDSLGEVENARGAYARFLKLSAADSGSNRMRRLRRDVLAQVAERRR